MSTNQGLTPMPETSGLGLSWGGNAKAAVQFSTGQLDIEALVECNHLQQILVAASQYQWEHNIRSGDDCLRRYVEAGFKIGVGAAETSINCRIGFCETFHTPQ
jgi:hypothetical protein